MKQSNFTDVIDIKSAELFSGSDIVRKFSFDVKITRDNCALLQVKDCFECLSSHGVLT